MDEKVGMGVRVLCRCGVSGCMYAHIRLTYPERSEPVQELQPLPPD